MIDAAALRYRTERFRSSRDILEARRFAGGRGTWNERLHPRDRDGKFTRAAGSGLALMGEGLRAYRKYRQEALKTGGKVGAASTVLSTVGGSVGTILGSAAGLTLGPAGAFGAGVAGGSLGARAGQAIGRRLDRHLPGITPSEAMALGMVASMASGRLLTASGASQRIFLRSGRLGRRIRSQAEGRAVAFLRSRMTAPQRARALKSLGPWIKAAKAARHDINTLYRLGYKIRRLPRRKTRQAMRFAGRVLDRTLRP